MAAVNYFSGVRASEAQPSGLLISIEFLRWYSTCNQSVQYLGFRACSVKHNVNCGGKRGALTRSRRVAPPQGGGARPLEAKKCGYRVTIRPKNT